MDDDKIARLRRLLAQGAISQEDFDALASPGPAAAHTQGSGASAAGDHAQAVAGRGAAVGRDHVGDIHTGDRTEHHQHTHRHTHQHAAPPTPGPTTQTLRRDYLRRVWRQTDSLALMTGGDAQRPVRLGRVYTPLITTLPDNAFTDDDHRAPARQPEAALRRQLGEKGPSPLGAVAALDRWRRLVLLGGPGSGKSSFVHVVAQCLAGEALGPQAELPGINLVLLTQPLPLEPSDDAQAARPAAPEVAAAASPDQAAPKAPPAQAWRHGALLPVLVVLRDLAAQLPPPGQPVGAEQVLQYLQRSLQAAGLARFGDALEAELRGPGALVMFDGLDEVPEAEKRRDQIQQVIEAFCDGFGECRVLVTCRPYAYQRPEWKLRGFTEAPLADFNRAQIGAFVQAWYAHMVELLRSTPADAEQRAQMLLRQVDRNPNVAELAQRPLLLTLFARLQHASGGDLPEDREALYFESVKLLLEDWERAKPRALADGSTMLEPSLSEWLSTTPGAVRLELNRLAFEAHRDQKRLEGTAATSCMPTSRTLKAVASNSTLI